MIFKLIFPTLFAILSVNACFADDSIKESAQEMKSAIKKAARSVKVEAKRGAGKVKKGFKSAKQDLKESL